MALAVSTDRRRANHRREHLEDRDAPAMLYVVGQAPLHLTLETFDSFDGRTWTQSAAVQRLPDLQVQHREGKPWITWRNLTDHPIFQEREQLAVKFVCFAVPPNQPARCLDWRKHFAWMLVRQISQRCNQQILRLPKELSIHDRRIPLGGPSCGLLRLRSRPRPPS